MHPLVRGAAAVAVLTALGSLDQRPHASTPSATPTGEPRGIDGLPAPCGPGTVPEGPVCIRIPVERDLASEAPIDPHSHRDVLWGVNRIPRRPERPADSAAYVYPVGEAGHAPRILGGFDSPLRSQPAATEQGGIVIAARPGERIVSIAFEHQEGAAEVRYVGDLVGLTIVTEHRVREGGRLLSYLLIHGRIDHADPTITKGARVEAGATLGFAKAAEGGGLIELYVEARQIHESAAGESVDGIKLVDPSIAAPIDLRNVLPLRAP